MILLRTLYFLAGRTWQGHYLSPRQGILSGGEVSLPLRSPKHSCGSVQRSGITCPPGRASSPGERYPVPQTGCPCGRQAPLYLPLLLLLAGLVFSSCSGLNFGGPLAKVTPTVTAVSSQQVALSQLHWCGKPLIIFRDEGAPPPGSVTPTATTTTTGTPTATAGNTPTPTATATPNTHKPVTITDWSQVERDLGFVVYLPETLPQNACLVSASGTVHDPIFGGSFTIGYLLPDHTSISLAEAPLRSQSRGFQCSASNLATPHPSGTPTQASNPSQAALQLCSGARDNTSIVFSAGGSVDSLQQFFNALQPKVNWVPAS